METDMEMPAAGAYMLESGMTDFRNHYGIAVDVYLENQRVGFIRCDFWKAERLLIVTDIDTDYRFRRRGLGRLRFEEVLKVLEQNGLEPKKIVAEDVGSYSTTPESMKAAEAFFKSLGFRKESDSDNWFTHFGALQKNLYAHGQEASVPDVRKVEAISP